MALKINKDIINDRLRNSGRTERLIGEFSGIINKTLFECEHGHTWLSTPHNIINGNGCPICSGKKLSKEIVNDRLMNEGRPERLIGDFTTTKRKTLFECANGHTWMATPHNILHGIGCPSCAEFGFNPDKPAWFYIIKITNDSGLQFVKVGISNHDTRRLKEHSRWGLVEIIENTLYPDGKDAVFREQRIKQSFTGSFVSKEVMPNGWTETYPVNLLSVINTRRNEYYGQEQSIKRTQANHLPGFTGVDSNCPEHQGHYD